MKTIKGFRKNNKKYLLTFGFVSDNISINIAKEITLQIMTCYDKKVGELEKHILDLIENSGIKNYIILNPHPLVLCAKVC